MKNDPVQIGKYGHPKPNPKPTPNLGTLNPTPNFNPNWVITLVTKMVLRTFYKQALIRNRHEKWSGSDAKIVGPLTEPRTNPKHGHPRPNPKLDPELGHWLPKRFCGHFINKL